MTQVQTPAAGQAFFPATPKPRMASLHAGMGWVVDDFAETFQANASLADITIEQADADDDVGQLAQLRYFLGSGEGNERPQTSSR